jgi:hypothetical protein
LKRSILSWQYTPRVISKRNEVITFPCDTVHGLLLKKRKGGRKGRRGGRERERRKKERKRKVRCGGSYL